jgi:hypothetical protein
MAKYYPSSLSHDLLLQIKFLLLQDPVFSIRHMNKSSCVTGVGIAGNLGGCKVLMEWDIVFKCMINIVS